MTIMFSLAHSRCETSKATSHINLSRRAFANDDDRGGLTRVHNTLFLPLFSFLVYIYKKILGTRAQFLMFGSEQ